MKTGVGINNDYAIVHNESYEDYFYYGYEETLIVDEEEEWAFAVYSKGQKVYTLSMSQLIEASPELSYGDEPAKFLLVGMYIYSMQNKSIK